LDYSSDWLPRVQLLMQQNRLPQAADELRRQLRLDPHEPVAHACWPCACSTMSSACPRPRKKPSWPFT
jgi:hypothetical protein